jgi:hypothetical protein
LRDVYARLVHGHAPSAVSAPPSPPSPEAVLEGVWRDQVRRVKEFGLTALGPTLNDGLCQVLQSAGAATWDGWRLVGAQAVATRHPRNEYAQVVVVRWRRVNAAGDTPERDLRVAVGFLVSPGRALPIELDARCAPPAEPERPTDGLILLWQAAANRDLPDATRKAWEFTKLKQASLRHLSEDQVCQLAAAAGWPQVVAAQAPDLDAVAARVFLALQFDKLLPLVVPPESWRSAEPTPAAVATQ